MLTLCVRWTRGEYVQGGDKQQLDAYRRAGQPIAVHGNPNKHDRM